MVRKTNWTKNLKKGAYREQLKRLGIIHGDDDIPITLSRRICKAKEGDYIHWGRHKIHVTTLLKKRACAAVGLYKMSLDRAKKSKKTKRR